MNNLIEAIKRYVELSEQDIELIKKLFVVRQLKKNECFVTPGKICDTFAFINNGLFKHSIFDSEGQEKVIYFSSENDFICDYESFISRQPSKKSIATLEDTTIIYTTYSNMQVFYSKVSSGERFGRLFLENMFNKTINHIVSMHTDSAEQLYLNFLSMYKDIQNRIPQYYIASFVGVTPQSLSRIRRNLVQK